MMKTAVDVRDLVVVRGQARAVDGVTCQVAEGEVTGLLGPSGCGKTTLMRSVVGVQIVSGGDITVLGAPAGHRTLRHRVGYLTQSPSVYDDLTAEENLRFFARVIGLDAGSVRPSLEAVGLADYADRKVGRLSGGQRSRVSLAAALLGRPSVLVLDEPTVGLDPVLRRDLWQLFHELAEAGSTVMVSSHVMDEAERCDRLLLMREGRLLADGSPTGLLESTGRPDVEAAFLSLVEGASRS